MDNIESKIKIICKKKDCNVIDIYYELYTECLANQRENDKILKKIFIECEKEDYTNEIEPVYITNDEVKEITNTYFNLLDAYVESLLKQNLFEEIFYDKLYNVVFKTDLFSKEKKVKVILLYLLSEKIVGIPYFQAVNLLKMTSEEYKQHIKKLQNQINRTFDIINRNFKSRTEEASQFYEIMSNLQSREDKIVYLSILISVMQKKGSKKLNKEEK